MYAGLASKKKIKVEMILLEILFKAFYYNIEGAHSPGEGCVIGSEKISKEINLHETLSGVNATNIFPFQGFLECLQQHSSCDKLASEMQLPFNAGRKAPALVRVLSSDISGNGQWNNLKE